MVCVLVCSPFILFWAKHLLAACSHSNLVTTVLQIMLLMPQVVLEFRVVAVHYTVQTFSFELGHV